MKHTAITLSDEDWDNLSQVLSICGDIDAIRIHDSIATQREAAAKGWNEKFGHTANPVVQQYQAFEPGTTTIQAGDLWHSEGSGAWLGWPPGNYGKINGCEIRRPIP